MRNFVRRCAYPVSLVVASVLMAGEFGVRPAPAGIIAYQDGKQITFSTPMEIPPKFRAESGGGSIRGFANAFTRRPNAQARDNFSKVGEPVMGEATANLLPRAFGGSTAENSVSAGGSAAEMNVEVAGLAIAFALGARYAQAEANSFSRVVGNIRELSSGVIVFSRALQIRGETTQARSGGPIFGQGRIRDPITATVYDLDTNEILADESLITSTAFLELTEQNFETGEESILEWDTEAGLLTVDAFSAAFDLHVGSALTIQQGDLSFRIEGGVVVELVATGIFSGLLPGIGAAGDFSIPLGAITLDLNFDAPQFQGRNLGMLLGNGTEGSAITNDGIIPEPSSLVLCAIGVGGALVGRSRCRRLAG